MPTDPPEARDGGPDTREIFSRYGGILSRNTAIYAIAMCSVFPFSLLQLAVFTRFLEPAEYGELALLMFFSGLSTMIMNLVTLQGALIVTYGHSGDDGGDDGMGDGGGDMGAVDEGLGTQQLVKDRQLALTTGVWIMVAVMVVVTVPVFVFATPIAGFLIHDPEGGSLVQLAQVSAIAGSFFRFMHNLLRMERRPWWYVVAAVMRPPLVVGLAVYFVVTAHEGVRGAVLGTALGTAISVLLCMVVARKNFRWGFSRHYVRRILVGGAPASVMHISMWLMHNADTFFLSRYSPNSQVGLYRLASRLASIPSYFVSAYTTAYPPLERTALSAATYEREGGSTHVKRYIFTYFILCCLSLVVIMSITADLLVLIAAPSYRDASKLIPILAVSFTMYGFFSIILRFSSIKHSRFWRITSSIMGVALLAAFSPLLIPPLGAYGAALAVICSMGCVLGLLLFLAARSSDPFVPQWGRVGRGFLASVVSWAVGTQLAAAAESINPWLHPLLGLVGLILLPVGLVVSGAVPYYHVPVLRDIVWAALPHPSRRHHVVARVPRLPARRRAVLEAIVRENKPPAQVAAEEHITLDEVYVRLSRAVRQVAEQEAPEELDGQIGDYLLLRVNESTAAQDAMVLRLKEAGMDTYALHHIESAFDELRRAPRRAWRNGQIHEGAPVAM
ncbi:oligosaccharide flippase family protein [Capillimicrobium parvum]|uniref:Polysaccharide biosynthesis protein C-terminal domain-containing protein n=1 Tax=Capillimicrobium parvum TaxID=2884022 RepID=A0A9E6Y218_9ACTN|nr:oligosaccharide flippase family protein [Capillimicrobium parvum]UGS38807.1 hypothetical protein DSM104329_05237 [Capillimicrobium parvum]